MRFGLLGATGALAAAALSCLVFAVAPPSSQAKGPAKTLLAQDVQPVPLPTSVFPLPAATINGWIAAGDERAIRARAWSLWAAMGAPTGQVVNGTNLPVWDTWWGTDELFPGPNATCASGAAAAKRVMRPGVLHGFHTPVQFHHGNALRAAAVGTDPAGVVSFNKFSPGEVQFLLTSQSGPSGTSYCYRTGASLLALNAAWPSTATADQRGINTLPNTSIETKPVMGLVKAIGFTAIPLWQGIKASTNQQNPGPATWLNCILVSPTYSGAMRPAKAAEIASAQKAQAPQCKHFLVAPLSQLYAFKLTAAEAASFNAQQQQVPITAATGDYAVLEAMHVSTKETANWTWQTFYWQPKGVPDARFPGSRDGQPSTLPLPWSAYASCTAYSQTTNPKSQTIKVCFNPYLETSTNIPSGITSNCMSCHGVAVVSANSNLGNYPANYTAPISFFTDPTYFQANGAQGTTHTDFSWAVAGAPLPSTAPSPSPKPATKR